MATPVRTEPDVTEAWYEGSEDIDMPKDPKRSATVKRTANVALHVKLTEEESERLRALAGRLENLSPLGVLARGYAVCWDDERTRIVRDAGTVQPGERVRVTLARGELGCVVERTET